MVEFHEVGNFTKTQGQIFAKKKQLKRGNSHESGIILFDVFLFNFFLFLILLFKCLIQNDFFFTMLIQNTDNVFVSLHNVIVITIMFFQIFLQFQNRWFINCIVNAFQGNKPIPQKVNYRSVP